MVALLGLLVIVGSMGQWVFEKKGVKERFSVVDEDFLKPHAEERLDFVKKRYRSEFIYKNAFENTAQRKLRILIVGDSFSEDLLRMIYEGNILPIPNVDIRTLPIPHRCQIYRGTEDVWPFIKKMPDAESVCGKIGKNFNRFFTEFDANILEADVVFFSFNWQSWSAERLPETISNFHFQPSTRIIVLGAKAFEIRSTDAKKYLHMPILQRRFVRKGGKSIDKFLSVNAILRKNLIGVAEFIDLHVLVCGENSSTCPGFTDQGLLIAYDGGHLTLAGSNYIGRLLAQHPVFQSLRKYAIQLGKP